MGIWDSLRRFSNRRTSVQDSLTKRRHGGGKKRLQARGLRLEKFEERMLLSITTPGLDDLADPGFGTSEVTLPGPNEIVKVMAADSIDDLRFKVVTNVNAADTTNAEDLQVGGSLGLDLTGAGYTVGVWDGGAVLPTHQEFGDRVTVVDGAESHYHATHVGGTIGASGVDSDAQGMATEVEIRSYDFADDLTEMAADGGLIDVSNHSYSVISGWAQYADSSTTSGGIDFWWGDYAVNRFEDPKFGQYSSDAAGLDQVLYSNPNLLSVWSAGNDRNDQYLDISGDDVFQTFLSSDPGGVTGYTGPGLYYLNDTTFAPPGGDGNSGTGYDSVKADQSAKNNLMVGAVDDVTADPYSSSDIVMASFSGWGPTDDGRIKPDVVGNGIDLYSTFDGSDTDYGTISGTSMSTPNVAGSSVLLIEHFENAMGYSPRSATTKGVILHTASDAGNEGPDYSYGWGLMDTKAAAEFVTEAAEGEAQFQIIESTYGGAEISMDAVSAGLTPLVVTLTWTDPAGTPSSGVVDDPTPRLVNDLDLWIEDSSGTIYYPWTLDPSNPAAPAVQTQANHIDNVEQVMIATPAAGDYTIHVGSTGGVSGQNFSLMISNEGSVVPPELVLVIPQESGFVERGATLNIAPRELTLRFNEGQEFINESSNPVVDPNDWLSGGRGGIQVTRSVNGVWDDGNDEIVEIGWIGIGDRPNDVVLRFAESLPDDDYRISIIGSDDYVGPDGQLVAPLRNTQFATFRAGQAIVDEHFEFELDLGAQVTAVVQQPVVTTEVTITAVPANQIDDGTTFTIGDGKDRVVFEFDNSGAANYVSGPQTTDSVVISIDGTDNANIVAREIAAAIEDQMSLYGGDLDLTVDYSSGHPDLVLYGQRVLAYGQDLPLTISEQREQLEDTIEVYFNDDDLALYTDDDSTGNAYDLRPEFFQLIVTNDTATPDDDVLYDPADGSAPVRKLQPVEIRYDADLDMAVLRFDKPLSEYGTGAFRLRIGNEYKTIETSSLVPSTEIVNGSLIESGENALQANAGSETADGTTFRISDGQYDATIEMDLQAVVLEVDTTTPPADGTILTIDAGDGPVDISLSVTNGASAAQVTDEIIAQLNGLGYGAVEHPFDSTRMLIANALSATPEDSSMTVLDPATFSLLVPTDLSTLVDGEWIEVDSVRYELDVLGGTAGPNDPAYGRLVDVTGSSTASEVAIALANAMQTHPTSPVSAVAVGPRVFFFDALSVSGSVPVVTQEDAVYSIVAPTATGDVEDGEWIEVNFGSEVIRYEFDSDGDVAPGSVSVSLAVGTDVLAALEAAIDEPTLTEIHNPAGGPRRLILSGVKHVQGGGVDPEMSVERGYVANVPEPAVPPTPDSIDGEYFDLFEEGTGWVRFEFDTDGIVSDPTNPGDPSYRDGIDSVIPVDVNDTTQTALTDAAALRDEVDTRGFSTILSGTQVYMFSGGGHELTDVRVGDIGATHLAIEDPEATSGEEDGVVEYHAGMTGAQIAERMADAMALQIAEKALYLRAASQGALAGVISPDDAGDSFHTANALSNFGYESGAHSIIISAAIDPQELLLEWPGAVDEPGHRDLTVHDAIWIEDHFMTGGSSPDITDGITMYTYNFADVYGTDASSGDPLLNQISEAQKERAREIFALYSEYLGVSFVETAGPANFQIVTGDLKATGTLFSEPGGVAGVAYGNMAIMDEAEDWGSSEFGGAWFEVAMHEIGHLLGYGHAYDLVAGSIMGTAEESSSSSTSDALYPGEHDIVHGQHMYRPDSIDVDLYRFHLETSGTLNAEVLAERMNDSSLLDSVITVYRQIEITDEDGNDKISYELVARNDDYYSEDSFVELYLEADPDDGTTYFVGVSASGNTDYDSNIENTGVGGTSQGEYELRLTFTPGGVDPDDPGSFTGDGTTLVDVDGTATKFDGDADGVPGGSYDFWFNVQQDTVFVDKASTSTTEDGTLANPYKTIGRALAYHHEPGTIIRVLGNNFDDDDPNDPSTYINNEPYELGYDPNNGSTLDDGRTLEVPQGVTLLIDAGAMFKLYGANIDVGSSAEDIDRSEGALQVLGTPAHSVIFTSFRDADLGIDIDPSNELPSDGDWGGLVFRNKLDYDFIEDYDPASGEDARQVLEAQGIFLNYVNHADLRYGGGKVNVDGLESVYAPIHMIEARPTVTHNRITHSADAALSADPNSFADTLFENWDAYAPFTSGYDRVGPEIRGNYIVENSTNGIHVRISTVAGSAVNELEVAGRFDDWDIVHVIPENLFINGTPGGPFLTERTNPLTLLDSNHIQALDGASIPDQSTFSIFDGSTRVVFEFDLGSGVADGHISIPYTAPDTVLGIDGSSAEEVAASIRNAIEQARIQYGLDISADVTESGNIVSLTNPGPLVRLEGFGTYDARLDARLQIDPGMIVKMRGSRMEVEMGAQLIAEGRLGSDEGPGYKVILTSFLDSRYGAGGTFDTTEITSGHAAEPGNWGGLYFSPTSTGSINQAIIAYGGGNTPIEGGFASFNTVEMRQAEVRIANSRFENNAAISTSSDRNGRGPSNAATIQVRGAQPVIVNNDFIDNQGAVVTIDVNSLVSETVADWGRTTGYAGTFEQYASNHGPLIRANRMTNNGINGMEVRAGIIATDSIWDDTDIVHVVFDEIEVPNYHHEGVLRLQSSDTESLVVKLSGDNAGFTAGGSPLEIDDRIGGTLQLLGQPGHPVVLTSLADDSVGAGFTLDDLPQNDTNNDGTGLAPTSGDWRSVLIDEYSNDRNVAVVNEVELPYGETIDVNCCATAAQELGSMAPEDKAGDDNLRLGFEVHGTIRTDDPTDADVYTFNAPAGTEIWLDIDRTNHAMDLVVELIKADGTVLARSDNSYFEDLAGDVEDLSTEAYTMNRDYWLRHDFYSTNDKDAGMRLVLPGPEGAMRTYYVRVRSVLAIGAIPAAEAFYDGSSYTSTDPETRQFTIADDYLSLRFEFTENVSGYSGSNIPVNLRTESGELRTAEELAEAIVEAVAEAQLQGLEVTARVLDGKVVLDGMHVRFNGLKTSLDHLANTSGEYQLQIRLEEMQEVPGSTIQYADIRYATNGIEVYGQPGHSPLLGETAEVENGNQNSNDTVDQAQQIGNLLQVDQNAISVAGYLENQNDVDWYAMSIDMGGIQSIPGINDLGAVWATIFDIDYADQMSRPDLNLWVFDSNRNLILAGGSSNVADDRTEPIPGAQIEDLSRGSVGARDPFIGTALLQEGNGNRGVYYIAVTSTLAIPDELDPVLNPLTRLEPINSVNRIASEHFQNPGTQVYNRPNTDDGDDADFMGLRLDPIPYEFTLGDTILYVSIGENLYTVDPFTGAFETEVTSQYTNTRLPNVSDYLFYDDIDMRNDGTLFTIESGNTNNSFGRQEPDVLVLSTEDARNAEQRTDTGITYYRRVPTNANALERDPYGGIQFEAMVHDWDNIDRNIYAIGTARDSLGLGYENLMYVLDPRGVAYTHPSILSGVYASGAREYSGEKVPLGQLYTAPTIVASPATQASGPYTSASGSPYYTQNDIRDGEWFYVNDGTDAALFEFDLGREFFLDDAAGVNAIRDYESPTVGHWFTVGGHTFLFDSGPVLVQSGGFLNQTTFDISGYTAANGGGGAPETVRFEIHLNGTADSGNGNTLINVASLDPDVVMPAIVAAINTNPSFAVTATLNDAGDRISLSNDRDTGGSSINILPGGGGLSQEGDYTPDPGGNTHLIHFNETDSATQFGEAIVDAISPYVTEAGYGARFGTDTEIGNTRDRLSIRGAGAIDMSNTPFVEETTLSNGDGPSFGIPVHIHAGMTAAEIATRIVRAIEIDGAIALPNVTASADGGNVELGGSVDDGNDVTFSENNQPLYATGVGGGGRITGLAYVGTQMYAVTDNGDLYMVHREHGDPASSGTYGFNLSDPDGTYNRATPVSNRGPWLELVTNISYDGQSIQFSGLTDGPSNAEDGAYAATLFATDPQGRLYCFDLDGNLLPIFNDGAERVQLDETYNGGNMGNYISSVDGIGGSARGAVTGLAFSPIDFNLWHATDDREGDLGHGVNTTHDGTRNREMWYGTGSSYTEGDVSMYFGLEDPDDTFSTRLGTDGTVVNWDQPTRGYGGDNFETGPASANIDTDAYLTYDLPGGAHGSFATTTFSLDGYSSQDEPTLYFNYYAETENSDEWDALRVYISNDGAKWDLVATNTDTNDGDRRNNGVYRQMQTPTVPTRIVDEIVDDGASWRQVRVDLSRYAGLDNLRLRFDVTTAGDQDIGESTGATTRDNQHHYMSAVPAYEIAEYDTFILDNYSSLSQRFEFDFGLALTLPNVAGAAINDRESFVVDDGVGGVVTFEFDKSYLLASNVADLDDLEGQTLTIRSDLGLSLTYEFDIVGDGAGGNVSISTPESTDAEDIAQAVVDAINGSGSVSAIRDGDRIYLSGDSRDVAEIPVADAQTGITVSSNYGVVDSTREPIVINDLMTTEEVIQAMIDRINVSLDVEGVAPNPDKDPNRLFLTRAMDLDVSGAPHLGIVGHAPVAGDLASSNIRVPISGDMTQAEVGAVIAQVVNQQTQRTRDTSAVVDVQEGSPEVIRVTSSSLSNSFTLQAVTYRGQLRTVTFMENPTPSPTPVVFNDSLVYVGTQGVATPADLAQRIADAINLANTGGPGLDVPELMVRATAETLDTGGNVIDVVTFDLDETPFTTFDAGSSSLSRWNANNEILNWDDGVGDLYNLVGWNLNDSGPLGYSGTGGFNGNLMGELEGEERIAFAWDTSGDYRMDNRFNLFERGQDNDYNGFYVDDIIVGFAERGEMVTDAFRDGSDTGFDVAPLPQPGPFPSEYPIVVEGSYQLEVRTGANYAVASGATSYPITIVFETMDTNDRMSDNFTLIIPAANEIHHGQWFELSDGRDDMTQRFVFVDETVGGGAGYGEIRIDFTAGETADDMAQKVADAINAAFVDGEVDISAKAIAESARVDLFDAVRLNNDPSATNPILVDGYPDVRNDFLYTTVDAPYPTTGGDTTFDKGDSNRERQKGQIVIAGNSITYSENAGIVVAPTRDSNADWPFPASPRTLNDTNDLVPGIMIENNLVAYSGQVGISFQGDSNATGDPVGAVPFGRIVNNTIYGGEQTGVGIDVGPNASPTLLNNIVANLGTGIRVDTTSATAGTVIGGTLYKDNGADLQGNVDESFAVILATNDPLFVDADNGNFYLDHGSLAIDSSIDSVEERQDFYNSILEPIGIPVSPILAPEVDMFGQLRRDDPNVASPIGIGQNVFKDRGAIDRVDFVSPTSSVTVPMDNDPDIDELDQITHDIKVVGQRVLKFTIQLRDTGGVGIDDASVVKEAIHLYRDLDESTYLDEQARTAELIEGDDYKMVYNATNDTIDLIPLSGLWDEGYDYTIVLDNSINDGIRDLANNPLQANRFSGTFNGLTVFRISLAGLDFGDAPDPYPSLEASDGPRHIIYRDFHLGSGVNSETDARVAPDANGDMYDDGVTIPGSGLRAGAEDVEITLNVTFQN